MIARSLITLAVLAFTVNTQAEMLTDPNDIVARADLAAYYAGADGRSDVRMIISDAQGRQQRRQFTVLRRDIDDAGDQQFLVVFSQPSDVRNTVFLVDKHIDRDDDRWLYLPGLDLVKRISSGDKRTSFVGSDYFYEDISGRGLEEDAHELLETTDECYRVKNTPKDPGSVEFAYYEVCVNPKNFLPMRIEYYDADGAVYRKVEALEVQEIDGHATTTRARLSNMRSGGYTTVEFRNVSYDVGLPDSAFRERSLRNPPRQWLGN